MARKRVLLYAHEGMGMGHLRRISRIAGTLAPNYSTLVLSGMRESAWIVPPLTGLVKLPDWDGLSTHRAQRVGRPPWIDLKPGGALAFRTRAILDVARLYRPDVMIVDYLPMGQRHELQPVLETMDCTRYLIHRGIADTSDSFVLSGEATRAIAAHYDRILVTSDPRLGNVADDDDYCPEARAITRYAGFVTAPPEASGPSGAPYIVCSGGGGYRAEPMIVECVAIARRNPFIRFQIVLGPRSRLKVADLDAPANCEVRQQRDDLADLHRDAAVLVTSGGYNSVLEAAFGGARVIVHPSQSGDDDEQVRFANALSGHHPVRLVEKLEDVEAVLLAFWEEAGAGPCAPLALDRGGDETIAAIVAEDLATGYRSPHRPAHGPPIVNLDGFRAAAQARLDREIFDYIDGGAGDELTRRANRAAADSVQFAPLVLRDVASVDPSWSGALGTFAAPVGIGPTALHRLVHPDGEVATASAARAQSLPMIVSMMASCPIEEIAIGSRHPDLWLQTYVLEDRGLGRELIDRAEAAGYRAIVVTVGSPVLGKRDRNLLNRFMLPAAVAPASFERIAALDHNNPIHSFAGAALDAGATWKDVDAIAAATALPVLVKGVMNPADVEPALASGAAGIMVSNHGGRQLDGTMASLRALPAVADAVAGRVPLLVDGGIRRGTDVAKAIALGADAAFIGSAALWALAVDGERGVARTLEILADEFANALALSGCADVAALRRDAATILRIPAGFRR
ncbi:MAG TPA: alpha-hydroxy-acid oxidizing protein [Allosphingosinicella sp.]|nr:alpha-hydroxy-acid oxidizing protein [Allosphingosinicella sp.]